MATSMDQMAPDASPGEVTKGSGVRRVNGMPLYILCGVITMFILVVALVAAKRSEMQNAIGGQSEEKAGGPSLYAKEITANLPDGVVPASIALLPAAVELAEPPNLLSVSRPSAASVVPPLRPMDQQYPAAGIRSPSDDLADRTAEEKRRQLENAMKAKTSVQFNVVRAAGQVGNVFGSNDPGSDVPPASPEEALARLAVIRQRSTAANADDPIAAYKARIAAVQSAGLAGVSNGAGSTSATGSLGAASASANDLSQFAGGANGQDRWKLSTQPERPRTRYELRAGFVIPATLISGINSELPGQIMAQVSQNVYDTATGKWLLIPQGARLVGSYSNSIIYGQSRVLVAWQRIVFPDGKAMDIGSMPGADSAGYAGFTDQTNNHYVRIFSSALLMSGVIAGVTYSQSRDQSTSTNSAPTAGSALSQALGQELGQVTAQMISKNLNIAPTLEIRPGYRFNVVAVKDLTFTKPYRSFDY